MSFKRLSVTPAGAGSSYDTLTASLHMRFSAPGYYQVTIQKGVEYLEEPVDPDFQRAASSRVSPMYRPKAPKSYRWFGKSTLTITAHAADEKPIIQIKPDGADEYQDIGKMNDTLLVGQLVNLRVSAPNPKTKLTKIKWTIPNKSFKDYSANNKKGILTPLEETDLKDKTIQFYWADAGDKELQCDANDGDDRLPPAKVTLHIKKPTYVFKAVIGDVFVGEYTIRGKESTRLILAKNNKGGLPGITFAARVQVPAEFEEGSWLFVQTLQLKRTLFVKYKDKTVTYQADTGEAKVLE